MKRAHLPRVSWPALFGGVFLLACAGSDVGVATKPGDPLPGLADNERGRFLFGKAVFERIVVPDEGLGPLFNADRCSACHDLPASGGGGSLLVNKATRWENDTCHLLESEGGDNLQQRVTPALAALGVERESLPAHATATATLVSPPLFGLGLIENIPAEAILANEDPPDRDGDGISGRAGKTSGGQLGRFGRKADIPTIRDFVDTALRFEVGLTTVLNPREEGVNGATLPEGVDPMPEPEIDENGLMLLTEFASYLAPLAHDITGAASDSVSRGEEIFRRTGCSDCHVRSFRTADHRVPALARREVILYSDLLLHDMGHALADVCGVNASPAEWRTSPLWGLRFRTRLMHDGRASTANEAILLHGGEAERVITAFRSLNATDQASLLRFLGSL